MRIFAHCMLLALLVAGCSPQRVGTAVGEIIGTPFTQAASVAADAPAFRPVADAPPDQAVVYVYRPATGFNAGGYPEVSVSGQPKFALKVRGYRPFTVKPGDYEIKAECGWNWYPPTIARTLSVQAGQEYYVRVVPSLAPDATADSALDPDAKGPTPSPFGACRTGRTLITLVPKREALTELSETRLLVE